MAMPVSMLSEAAETLRALHLPGRPLVLPNAWDVTSARLVVRAGFPVVATSSAALNSALGLADGGMAAPGPVFDALARICRAVSVPVTADVEDGYGLYAPTLVDTLLAAGAAGCNLEDSDHLHGALVPVEQQAEWLAEVKDAAHRRGVDLVVNARIDTFLRGATAVDDAVAETIHRAQRYFEAGVDCVYPIAAPIAALAIIVNEIEGPVNALAGVDEPLDRLTALGVARISFGPRLATTVGDTLLEILERLAAA
jgi:2-methylisocitrate lyase-like PEP mutase family enzyme